MRLPEEQFRAGHIPTELYRQIPPGTDPAKVVIVQAAPRSYAGPILLTLAITAGATVVLLVLVMAVQAIAASIVAIVSAFCGIGLTLNRASHRTARSRRPSPHRSARTRPGARSKKHYRR